MTTQAQNEKPKHSRKLQTEIEYLEKGHWEKGKNIITVMGGLPNAAKSPIGYIQLVDYDQNKKPVLAALDPEGNEIFERSSNLYQLKKQFRDSEERLTKAMLIRAASNTQQEEPEQSRAEEKPLAEKSNELNNTRRRKSSNEQSQSISH